jgi:uncharacterized membrane protein YhaH (DUF805 family)
MNIDWNDLFLKPTGRIGQKEFWIGIIIIIIANCINAWVISHINGLLSNLVGLALLYPSYCVLGSRFADIGKTAKLAFLPFGIMAAGFVLLIVGGLIAGGSAVAGSTGGAMGGGLIFVLGGFAYLGGAILGLVFVI